jgi:proteasome lid subunit RPN8/RPN11
LSYVSIAKPVNEKIVRAARRNRNEVIGLLIGRLQDNTIIIENSVTGETTAEPHRAVLSSSTLAKVADDILTGRMKGNIVGWYHSHTRGGLFFSRTDIATQTKLQQFSTLIAGMVVDATTGDVGFFRVEPSSGQAIRIPVERITVYAELADAIRPEATEPSASMATAETRQTSPRRRILGVFGAVGPLVYVAAVLLGGFLWPAYSHYSQTVSFLTSSEAPNQIILIPLFVLYNVCVILLGLGLYYGTEKEFRHVWGPAFLIAAGTGGLILFSLEHLTSLASNVSSTLHLVITVIIAFFTLAAIALCWLLFRPDPRWKGYDLFSLVMLPIAICLCVFAVVSTSAPYAGLADRLYVGSVLLWMEIVSLGLIMHSSRAA